MKKQQRETVRMQPDSVRLFPSDRRLWLLATEREGITRSEFLRRAIRERAQKILIT